MIANDLRLGKEAAEAFTFYWNGKPLRARAGDSLAAALHAAGVLTLAHSRKFHVPRGLSGSYIAGHLVQVDGTPHCRADHIVLKPGMDVRMQHSWPAPGVDLLSLARLVPRKWLRAGFEHPRLLPDATRIWNVWERALWHVAGEVDISRNAAGAEVPGRQMTVDNVIVGGGFAGIAAAQEAKGRTVLLTRSDRLGGLNWEQVKGAANPPENVTVLTSHEVFGIFDGGRTILAAPHAPDQPAVVIACKNVILATGKRSLPPPVPGIDLPGVMDVHMAHHLAARHGVAPGARIALVGTEAVEPLAHALRSLGCTVAEVAPVAALQRIAGRHRMTSAVIGGHHVDADCLIHAGPFATDPSLGFQASSDGDLRLLAGPLPDNVRHVGWAAEPDGDFANRPIPGGTLICPCMDVTAEEVVNLIQTGVTHPEEIKRRSTCGMGACQGYPCWLTLEHLLAQHVALPPGGRPLPTFRPPRRALTFGQAAGLADLTKVET